MCKVAVSIFLLTIGVGVSSVGPYPVEARTYPAQAIDRDFDARVTRPAYTDRHPKVLFDEAHFNADKSDGRYKPFTDLITNDGYGVMPNKRAFSKDSLAGYELLVIANPAGSQAKRDGPAFTEEECSAVVEWVNAGGSLLLIVDHLPFTAAASALSKRFDIDLTKGHSFDKANHSQESGDETELVFTRDNHLLQDHLITRGRDAGERINQIITFSGTSVKGPKGSVQFLKLADTAMDVLPPEPKKLAPDEAPPDHKLTSAAGRAQGIAVEYGKGRIVVLGEAAMLTAQVASRGFRFGMNVPGFDNRQLALNIMHWLSGLLK